MIRTLLISIILFLPALLFSVPANACGPDTDCMIGDRHYRIRMPESYDGTGKIGAIVFSHGYRGSAKGMMRNKSMASMANKLGIAIIAAKSAGDDWLIPGVPSNTKASGKIELSYFDSVIEDVTKRFPIDRERLVATGFSAGGMMVWNLICHRSELFAGFAPMAGTFWEPEPETCTTPPKSVIHIHGTNDNIVPLLGRPIADTHQGQVPQVLDMYSAYGKFEYSSEQKYGELDCKKGQNPNGEIMQVCLHPGGHSFKSAFVRHAWQALVEAGRL